MAKRRTSELAQGDLRKYAVLGAEARLLQLAQEAAAIYRAFPELRDRSASSSASSSRTPKAATHRRSMSAAQRKAVGERMKAYWAKRRAEAPVAPSGHQPVHSSKSRRQAAPQAPKKK